MLLRLDQLSNQCHFFRVCVKRTIQRAYSSKISGFLKALQNTAFNFDSYIHIEWQNLKKKTNNKVFVGNMSIISDIYS